MDEASAEMGLDGKRLGKCVIAGAERNVHAIEWLMTFHDRRLDGVIDP